MSDLRYYWYPTGSYSPGAIGPNPVRLCVHTTEGATTLKSITGFIQGANGVSYHAAVDNYSRGACNEFVYESDGAWAQCGANGSTVCLVMCTPSGASASWSADYWWNQQAVMMDNAAKWLADQSAQYGIPLTELTSAQAQGSTRGVCQHKNLGSWGCSHSDCGNLPMGKLLDLARQYAGGAPVGGPEQPPAAARPKGFADMAMIEGLVTEPVPSWANKLLLASDPAYQGASHVKVRVARYDTTGKTWPVSEMDCSAGYPLQTVNVADYEIVTLTMAKGSETMRAGYCFDV